MIYVYDGSYEGVLSTIFSTFQRGKEAHDMVVESQYQPGLFHEPTFVTTDAAHARRVLKGMEKRCGQEVVRLMYEAFLSEQAGIEMLLYQFVRLAVESPENVLHNFREPCVLKLHQIGRQIHREVHRMHAFVRFQQTNDGLFVAMIAPDYNVLPLLPPHFVARYPAFCWLIYDTRRHYGIYHQQQQVDYITLQTHQHHQLAQALLTASEKDYQQLWKTYFKSVDIPERRNLKLHLQHVPKRYWKYLIEKS